MLGFDFDGVVSLGFVPSHALRDRAVIVTGRTLEESKPTLEFLHDKQLWLPVFFNPVPFSEKSIHASATHKARVCQLLGITTFYEDCGQQAEIISEFARGVRVCLIEGGKRTKQEFLK